MNYTTSYSLVAVPFQERFWVCTIFKYLDAVDNANSLKSLCIDNNTLPTGLDSLVPKIRDIPWPGEPLLPVKGISCISISSASGQVLCDLSMQGPEVVELILQLTPSQTFATFSTPSSTTYYRHGENFGHQITTSPDYFACTTYSLNTTLFNNILIFRRTRTGKGSQYVYYSIPASEIYPTSKTIPAEMSPIISTLSGLKLSLLELQSMTIFINPIDSNWKLLIVDSNSGSLGRIYNIAEFRLEISNVGLYESMRWRDVNLTINQNYVMTSNVTLYDVFFPQSTPNRDIRDAVASSLLSILKYWLYGFLVIIIISIPLLIYYYRREKLKKYTGND